MARIRELVLEVNANELRIHDSSPFIETTRQEIRRVSLAKFEFDRSKNLIILLIRRGSYVINCHVPKLALLYRTRMFGEFTTFESGKLSS